jgi:hypothetical protein
MLDTRMVQILALAILAYDQSFKGMFLSVCMIVMGVLFGDLYEQAEAHKKKRESE